MTIIIFSSFELESFKKIWTEFRLTGVLLINPIISRKITEIKKTPLPIVLDNSKSISELKATKNAAELYKIIVDNKAITEKFLEMINDKAFMCIPLMPFIEQIVSVEFERVKKDIAYLSQIENQIREIIMFKSPKYIELLIDNDNIKPLIIREDHKKAQQLADFFLNNKLPKTARLLIEPRAQDNYKLTILTK